MSDLDRFKWMRSERQDERKGWRRGWWMGWRLEAACLSDVCCGVPFVIVWTVGIFSWTL
jgi:hypothetical protein